MSAVVIWENTAKIVQATGVADGMDPNLVAASVVPSGSRSFVLDATALPNLPPEQWIVHWDTSTVSPGDLPPPTTVSIQQKRAALINSGCVVVVSGTNVPVWANETAQGTIAGALVAAQTLGAAYQTLWKGSDGNFYPINNSGMLALALGVFTYISQCFACEATVKAALAAGTVTTQAQVDAAAWPSPTVPIVPPALPTATTADNLTPAVAQLQATVANVISALNTLGKPVT
jgi:Domain of unknown function (DUF4376)